ncbi:hypothetical protein ACFY3G_17715 [Streptomyces phaeochromogenes]|uniref:hypothetical protein n=1 Tax=Streptomyces phaeochromogenes TaxID=1923 RepID=UPI00368F4D97
MIVVTLFYALVAIGLYFVAQAVAGRLDAARPLPRVTQRQLPPLPGAYVEEVRYRIPGRLSRGRRAGPTPDEGGRFLLLACEGYCAGRTPHEDDGDGTGTCRACGTPRSSTPDGA